MSADDVAFAQRGLAQAWIEFESGLATVPVIARLLAGRLRLEDYRALLLNIRQQVVEGSRWISRASSHLSQKHEELRSLFVRHAAAEHRDFLLLEQDFAAAGGDPALMRATPKNIGSEALSAWMYHAAGQPDPIGLLGAMFVIEGLGQRLALPWSEAISAQLSLPAEAVSFLRYHGENDDDHLAMFDEALRLAIAGRADAETIVRHARVTARLYRLQLEELDNV
ncbi:MAG TPA: iron-containing redox enzyme family protein [Allosphingosinicella sp.]|nr:iron-containing redox enzyme family protein [Allosphingosinicella sp.]